MESAVTVLGLVATGRRRAALSREALEALAYVGWHGDASRRDRARVRGHETDHLCTRLVGAGLLVAGRDDTCHGRPKRYRPSTAAIRALGIASPEELRGKLAPLVHDLGPAPRQATPYLGVSAVGLARDPG